MAIDKAVDSTVLESGLTKVANAIRTKGGTSAQLAFPDGMAAAITAIEAGGSGAKEPYIEYTYTASTNFTNMTHAKMHGYKVIPINQFYWRSELVDVDMPDEITIIESEAFSRCTNLALTSLPEGITSIKSRAFQSCRKLGLTSLPEGVTSIETEAFSYCTGLSKITFKGTPSMIAKNAFTGCTNLLTINVPWAEGAVANAPWGATNATINYNYVNAGDDS